MKNSAKSTTISCREVWSELVNYMEDDLSAQMRQRIEKHLEGCAHCTAIYDGTRNLVQLLGRDKALDLPPGFSRHFYERFLSRVR